MSQRSATKQIDYINAGLPAGVCTFPRRQSPNGWGSGVSSAWWRTGREAPVSRHCIYIPYPSWDCSWDLPVDCLWGNIAMDWHKKHLWGFITKQQGSADQEPGSFTVPFSKLLYFITLSTWCVFRWDEPEGVLLKVKFTQKYKFSVYKPTWLSFFCGTQAIYFTECVCCSFYTKYSKITLRFLFIYIYIY